MTSSGATVDKRQRSRTLRALPPLLNFLIIIGSQKPLLEHFGKRSEAIRPGLFTQCRSYWPPSTLRSARPHSFSSLRRRTSTHPAKRVLTSRAVVGVADVRALGQCIG